MSVITAQVVADSVNNFGDRLTTCLVTYPRFIHAEHLRHRMFSFSVSSSRAIPTKKFAQLVRAQPVNPIWWGKAQSGMAAREELTGWRKAVAQGVWTGARNAALGTHMLMRWLGVHKQIANRLLEPWMPVTVLVTGTDWKNFFSLRCHGDAQPEIAAPADLMLARYLASTPQRLNEGEWHLPFGDRMLDPAWPDDLKVKVCVSRAARQSYYTYGGTGSSILGRVKDTKADVALHDKLAASGHWSPFEHVATPAKESVYSGNLKGWVQYRKTMPSENIENTVCDLQELLQQRIDAGSVYARG